MAEMTQRERDEISDSFAEAWRESFGQEMFYVPFDEKGTEETVHKLYKESKHKSYLFDKKVPFHGTYKQEPIEEVGELGGKRMRSYAEITFVTKELRDQGIDEVDERAIIQFFDENGKEHRVDIISLHGKVQFITDRIFTKLRVVSRYG